MIVITLDTTRADHLGCYGNDFPITPNIDALAKCGLVFEHAYAPMPQTLPSHATLFTGLEPRLHGTLLNSRRLPEHVATLAEVLADDGYQTAAFTGAAVVGPATGIEQGFQHFDGLTWNHKEDERMVRRSAAEVTDAALAWAKRARRGQPYFLWVHYYDAHHPFDEHEAHVRQQVPRASVEAWLRSRRDAFPAADLGVGFDELVDHWHGYACEMRAMDREIGRLWRGLAELERLEHAWIVIAGDHGEGLWEHGERGHGVNVYEELMRVPLIFADTDGRLAGRRTAVPVALQDVFPTVLELVRGRPLDRPVSGRSLAPLILGTGELEERPVFVERPHFPPRRLKEKDQNDPVELTWGVMVAVIQGGWKCIAQPDAGFVLHDLASDPEETSDCSTREPERARALEALIAEWLERHPAPPPGKLPRGSEVSPEQLEALRALGYAGDG